MTQGLHHGRPERTPEEALDDPPAMVEPAPRVNPLWGGGEEAVRLETARNELTAAAPSIPLPYRMAFGAAGQCVGVGSNAPEFFARMEQLWQPFAAGNGADASRQFALVDLSVEADRFPLLRDLLAAYGPELLADLAIRYQVLADGQFLFGCARLDDAINYLDWVLTTETLLTTSVYAVYHSAVLEYRGRGLLLPAASGSGKTTLTAALIRAGFAYLSDEAALVDPTTLRVYAYPKWLSIKRPALTAQLLGLPADIASRAGIQVGMTWHVDPTALGATAVASATAITAIVFPRYRADQPTALSPLSRGVAAAEMIRYGINARARPPGGIQLAAALVGRAKACSQLIVNDLATAVELMRELLEPETHRRAPTAP